MGFFSKLFPKKKEYKDIEDDLLNDDLLSDDSQFIEEPENKKGESRTIQEVDGTWLKDWMIWAFGAICIVLFLYIDGNAFKIHWPSSDDPEEKSTFKPIELNWSTGIEEKLAEKIKEVEKRESEVSHHVERKAEQKAVKIVKYGAFKRYTLAGGSPEKKDKPSSKQKEVKDISPEQIRMKYESDMQAKTPAFDKGSYVKDIIAGLNNKGETKQKTLNEKLNVEPLKKVSAIQDYGMDYHIYKGTKIPAIINEHMSTDLGGFISSVITGEIYSSNGVKSIIPIGSIATGRYPAGLKEGVNLAFTVWEDIRTPCGATIKLGSPGTSPMGLPGQKMKLDNHYIERFGSSMMFSLINAAVSTAAGFATQGSNQTVSDIQANLNRSAEIALEHSIDIKPTGYAEAGQEITIMVARDLDFKNIFNESGELRCGE
jgi:type IV secretory pathway VirB10-like protein